MEFLSLDEQLNVADNGILDVFMWHIKMPGLEIKQIAFGVLSLDEQLIVADNGTRL